MNIINEKMLIKIIDKPYKIWIIDNFLKEEIIDNILNIWPYDKNWYGTRMQINGKPNILEEGMIGIKTNNIEITTIQTNTYRAHYSADGAVYETKQVTK